MEIDEVCHKHDIQYLLAAGGALGAIRNGGFLPWDDDLDIYMTRKNWEKFRDVMERELKPNRFFVHNDNTPTYRNPLPRYGTKEDTLIYWSLMACKEVWGQHIEIFIFDPIPNDEKARQEYIELLKVYTEVLSPYIVVNALQPGGNGQFHMELYKKYIRQAKIVGEKRVLRQLEKKLFVHQEDDCDDFCMRWGVRTYIFPKECFTSVRRVPFEDVEFDVSGHVEKLFRIGYGDSWMYVPSIENQVTHNGIHDETLPAQEYYQQISERLDHQSKIFKYFEKRKRNNVKVLFQWEKRFDFINDIIATLHKNIMMRSLNKDIAAIREYLAEGETLKTRHLIERYQQPQIPYSNVGKSVGIFYSDEFCRLQMDFYLHVGESYRCDKILNTWRSFGHIEPEDIAYYSQLVNVLRSLSIAIYDEKSLDSVKKILSETGDSYGDNIEVIRANLFVINNEAATKKDWDQLLKVSMDGLNQHHFDGEAAYYQGIAYKQLNKPDQANLLFNFAYHHTRNGLIRNQIRKNVENLKMTSNPTTNDHHSTKSKEIFKIKLDLLEKIDSICRELDLHYSLIEKSVTSAVNNVIPNDEFEFSVAMKYEDYKIFSNKICTDEKFKQYYVEDDRHNSILIGSSRAFFGNSTTTFFRPTQVFYPKNTCIKVKIFFVKVGKTSNYARQVLRFYKGVSLFFSEYLHENMKPIEKALVSLGKGVFGFAWRHGLNDRYLKFMKKHIWINESYNGERVTIARTKLFLEDWNRSTDIKYNHLNLKIPNHLLTWHFEGHGLHFSEDEKIRTTFISPNDDYKIFGEILEQKDFYRNMAAINWDIKKIGFKNRKYLKKLRKNWRILLKFKGEKMNKATNDEKDRILAYIGKDYGKCIYLYLDMQQYGVEGENVSLWYGTNDEGEINVILLKYYTGMHIFSKTKDFNKDDVKRIIVKNKPNMLSGMKETIDYLEFGMEGFDREDGQIIRHLPLEKRLHSEARRATFDEIKDIVALLAEDEELGKPYGYDLLYKQLSERFRDGYGRNFVIYDKDELVAHSGTYAEGFGIAVTGGMIVNPKYRGAGKAALALSANLESLSQDGIDAFALVYDSAAIRTSEKLGCESLGTWTKIIRKSIE